jgi:hypothetical protein
VSRWESTPESEDGQLPSGSEEDVALGLLKALPMLSFVASERLSLPRVCVCFDGNVDVGCEGLTDGGRRLVKGDTSKIDAI